MFALRRLTLRGIEALLSALQLEIGEDEVARLAKGLSDGILPMIKTGRSAKRYLNAIAFAVPLLAGEVNLVDLLLVEALRSFHPKLHSLIITRPAIFLGDSTSSKHRGRDEQHKRELDAVMVDLEPHHAEGVRTLLHGLFPSTVALGLGFSFGGSEEEFRKAKRIASEHYFSRFFRYSVPGDDFADHALERLLDCASRGETSAVERTISAALESGAIQKVLEKINYSGNDLSPEAAESLAIALTRIGGRLPEERGPFSSFISTRSLAAQLVSLLIGKVSTERREDVCLHLMQASPTIGFAASVINWLRRSTSEDDSSAPLSTHADVWPRIFSALADRVVANARVSPPWITDRDDLANALLLWRESYGPESVNEYLRNRFHEYPNDVFAFIECFVTPAYSVETGLPSRRDLMKWGYDSIAAVVDPEIVITAIWAISPALRGGTHYWVSKDVPRDERIARQFLHLHDQGVRSARGNDAAEGQT